MTPRQHLAEFRMVVVAAASIGHPHGSVQAPQPASRMHNERVTSPQTSVITLVRLADTTIIATIASIMTLVVAISIAIVLSIATMTERRVRPSMNRREIALDLDLEALTVRPDRLMGAVASFDDDLAVDDAAVAGPDDGDRRPPGSARSLDE